MIKLLECTLRDGGLALEDANKNNISATCFTKDQVHNVTYHLNKSNLDIVELGSIEITDDDRTKFCIYQNIEEVSKYIPDDANKNILYVALFRGPDTPVEDIPYWRPGLVEGLRVIIRYSELQKSLDFCAELSRKGYKVFVQPMLTMRYSDEELDLILNQANEMNAYACYFVDSYGYMNENDVARLYSYYNKRLKSDIIIGFHAHNNLNLAFSNAHKFIDLVSKRDVILDSCVIGMGQGAGNLQTELIANYLIESYQANYNFSEILEVCEIIEMLQPKSLWGYSVTRMLSAIHKVAYKFSVSFREKHGLSFSQINTILKKMPVELKHRYTEDIAKDLLVYKD